MCWLLTVLGVLNHSVPTKMGGGALRVLALSLSLQAYAHFVHFCAACFAELLYGLTKEIVMGEYFCLCI